MHGNTAALPGFCALPSRVLDAERDPSRVKAAAAALLFAKRPVAMRGHQGLGTLYFPILCSRSDLFPTYHILDLLQGEAKVHVSCACFSQQGFSRSIVKRPGPVPCAHIRYDEQSNYHHHGSE